MTPEAHVSNAPMADAGVGRAFIVVDRGNVDAEVARLAGPGGVQPGDLFVAIVPVQSAHRISPHAAGGADVPF